MRVGIIAAMSGELKPLVCGWQRKPTTVKHLHLWTQTIGPDELIAVCGGMGAQAALRSFAAIEASGPLDLVLSVGWAGALEKGKQAGECYVVSEIIDSQTGECFSLTIGDRKLRLVTTPRVADEAEKRRLWQTYGAVLVDMEAAAIARLAQIRSLPMYCFKAVSDGVEANLPSINSFISNDGQLRLLPFLAHVALRPRYWGSLLQLGRTSATAAKALATTITNFLQTKDVEATNRTGAA
ncbi:MAG: nucleoside phosphorylase [Edaphobacter sp.]